MRVCSKVDIVRWDSLSLEDSTGDGWKTLLDRFQLMPNVNAEPGANDFFTIRQDMVSEIKDRDAIYRLSVLFLVDGKEDEKRITAPLLTLSAIYVLERLFN